MKAIFLFYILCVILQDLSLQLWFGTIARSPYVFLSPLVFLLITGSCLKFYFEKEISYYLIYYAYSIIIAVFLIIYYVGIKDYDMHVYGENLIVKFIKSSIYNLIIILTLYNFIFILKNSSLSFVEKILKVLVVVQVCVGFVQIVVPAAFDLIKTPQLLMTERLTLLNTEPSQTFPQLLVSLLCYLAIRFYRFGNMNGKDYLISLAAFSLLILIQSKGGLAIMLICFFLIMLFTKQKLKNRLKLLFASLVFIIPTVWLIMTVIIPTFLIDMEKDFGSFTSLSTRAVTIFSALESLVVYPFGQGYSTYLITYPELLEKALNNITLWSSYPVSGFEIDWMIETGRALTVKSGLLNETLYSGWAIIIFYIFFFSQSFFRLNTLKTKRAFYIVFKFTLLFIIVNYLLVTNLETSYVAFLPFALLIKLNYDNEKLIANKLLNEISTITNKA